MDRRLRELGRNAATADERARFYAEALRVGALECSTCALPDMTGWTFDVRLGCHVSPDGRQRISGGRSLRHRGLLYEGTGWNATVRPCFHCEGLTGEQRIRLAAACGDAAARAFCGGSADASIGAYANTLLAEASAFASARALTNAISYHATRGVLLRVCVAAGELFLRSWPAAGVVGAEEWRGRMETLARHAREVLEPRSYTSRLAAQRAFADIPAPGPWTDWKEAAQLCIDAAGPIDGAHLRHAWLESFCFFCGGPQAVRRAITSELVRWALAPISGGS